MSREARDSFYKWYEECVTSEYNFNLKEELRSYCINDVDILHRACLAFRALFLKVANVDPFIESITIASACSKVFRKNYLKADQIGVIPNGGYRRANRQSKKAIEWLLALERNLDIEITHSGRAREFRLPEGCLVDGYFENKEVSTKVVYQFHGCCWHGCPQCFKLNRGKKLGFDKSSESLNDRFERTNAQTDRLRSLGYEVVEKWECSFDKEKIQNDNLRSFLKDHPLLMTDALNPRDAFYGGRTGNTFSYYEAKGKVKISYLDVCSLYPFVSKYGKFPIGHPKVYIGDDCKSLTGVNFDLSNVEGLVKCRVLPPTNKYLPVLPVRMHGKLMFPLCNTCCKEQIQSDCPH
ncbi:uncharacterized protein LOC117182560, partial [Belonocnema kinseyi]|uniref:uncharacterized protein LOC117182560 n=1 Tax=Belonocnema kinseyi TaxID=2817044 RepID=UPI00143D0C70